MEKQIIDMLVHMQQQMGRIVQDVTAVKEDVAVLKQDVSILKEDVTVLKQDMLHVKESIHRIEVVQNDDTVALLQTINGKVDAIQQRQEESDRVVDLHSILITRMQANMMMSG